MRRFLSVLSLSVILFLPYQAQAQFTGEFHFNAQFGGTDFKQEGTTDYKHDRSWEFAYNQGAALGLRYGYRLGVVELGLGVEYGWKEEGIDRRNQTTGAKNFYDFQMTRLYAGPHIVFYPVKEVVQFYFGYDPLVASNIFYADDRHTNPFRKNDEWKGTAFTAGLGFRKDNFLIRFLGRKTTYTEIEVDGTRHKKLPDDDFSKVTTDEFILQIGTGF